MIRSHLVSALALTELNLQNRHTVVCQSIPFKLQTHEDYIKQDEARLAEQAGMAEMITAEPQGEEVAPRALPGSQGMPGRTASYRS